MWVFEHHSVSEKGSRKGKMTSVPRKKKKKNSKLTGLSEKNLLQRHDYTCVDLEDKEKLGQ